MITFLSDYGLDDDFVGVCHGVIARHLPRGARDRHHPRRAPPRHPRRRADAPRRAAVHAGGRAPGGRRSGRRRRTAGGRAAAGRRAAARRPRQRPADARGGRPAAGSSRPSRSPVRALRLEPVSATFHGRDIFAPVAAQLAAGSAVRARPAIRAMPPSSSRSTLPRRAWVEGERRGPRASTSTASATCSSNVGHDELIRSGLKLGRAVELALRSGDVHPARYVRTFADVSPGELLVYEDADRVLAVAVNHGSAARAARRRDRRRAADQAAREPRHAPSPPPADGLDERAARASSPRAALRTARSSPPPSRPPVVAARAGPGPRPAGRALLCSVISASRRGCCRSRRASRSPSARRRATRRSNGPTTCWLGRAQGRRDPRRGPPARGLGGARHRPQRRAATLRTSRRSCARPRPDLGLEPDAIEPTLERLLELARSRG